MRQASPFDDDRGIIRADRALATTTERSPGSGVPSAGAAETGESGRTAPSPR
jgi:hypothetical protein